MGLLGKLLRRGQTAARYPLALLPSLALCIACDWEGPALRRRLGPSLGNESLTLKIREQRHRRRLGPGDCQNGRASCNHFSLDFIYEKEKQTSVSVRPFIRALGCRGIDKHQKQRQG